MRNRINRMEKRLEDLLTCSRAGRTDTLISETNVADIFDSIIEFLSPPAHIKVRVDGVLPIIVTAIAQLGQVLRNLINNAIKHHDKQSGEGVLSGKQGEIARNFRCAMTVPAHCPNFTGRSFNCSRL